MTSRNDSQKPCGPPRISSPNPRNHCMKSVVRVPYGTTRSIVSQEVSNVCIRAMKGQDPLSQAGQARILRQVMPTATWEGCEKNSSSRPASCHEEKSRRHGQSCCRVRWQEFHVSLVLFSQLSLVSVESTVMLQE